MKLGDLKPNDVFYPKKAMKETAFFKVEYFIGDTSLVRCTNLNTGASVQKSIHLDVVDVTDLGITQKTN